MTFDGALVKEQGVTFAIIVVKSSVLSSSTREETRASFSQFFPTGIPIILMAQNSKGIPTYHGREDIVKFLASIDFRRIPWKKYTIS